MKKQTIAFINPSLSTENVGDLFIEDSVKRVLNYDKDTSIDIDPRRPVSDHDIDSINACDAAVIVGTNLWYSQLLKPGRWMLSVEDLRKIKIPFIPLGVGTTQHRNERDSFSYTAETLAILNEVHSKCNESSARDPITYEAIKKAGISNVRMTGCPTLYRSLKQEWHLNIKETDDVVLTVRKGHDVNVKVVMDELISRGKKPIIAAQKKNDLYCARKRFPSFKKKTEALYVFDVQPYQALVDNTYGAIGWRLHGNMLHLAHGNPTMFFANCSRCQSFSEAFGLPCIYAEDKEKIKKKDLVSAVELFLNPSYFADFKVMYTKYYKEMAKFLDMNNLKHNLAI
jgi:polysaccharide pyruvyl transferase WcaK-like protein